jgi:hypothetical protein
MRSRSLNTEWNHLYLGTYDDALAFRERTLVALKQFNLRWFVYAHTGAALVRGWRGEWNAGLDDARAAFQAAQDAHNDSLISFSAWGVAFPYMARGDVARGLPFAELGVAKAQTLGEELWAPAMLDRRKCKAPLSGPAATGNHCPEGFASHKHPGPQFDGFDNGSAEASYYTWVDHHNTSGLGENVPISTANLQDGRSRTVA